jgi:hypothetical protein
VRQVRETLKINALIVLVSAIIWIGAFKAHDVLLPMTSITAGIDLIFIPSGIRFFALLIGGVWAAVGVSLGSLFLAGPEFNIRGAAEIFVIAACSGFAPYVSLLVTQRLMGMDRRLTNLFARHLPVLAFGTAAGSAILHNLLFWAFGFEPGGAILSRIFAMATGDFAGSLLVVILVIGVMRLYRQWR